MRARAFTSAVLLSLALAACTGSPNFAGVNRSDHPSTSSQKGGCSGAVSSTINDAHRATRSDVRVSKGFTVETIASFGTSGSPRELAALPNGDLLVGTSGYDTEGLWIVPHAEGAPGGEILFAKLNGDKNPAGVAFAAPLCKIFVATTDHIWAIPYHDGDLQASKSKKIADVRSGPVVPGTDGDVHVTTSVAYSEGKVYAAAGSSCNATMDNGQEPCTEIDPTRAAVSIMNPDGSDFTQRAKRIRNAIAVTVDPQTGAVWVGGAGQDDLPFHHPYEYLDNLSAHPGDADYGWPECEENHHVYWPGYHCHNTVVPLVELPAYSTIIGAIFYPLDQTGRYAFPAAYRGGLFVAVHGSWHAKNNTCYVEPPRVVFVPMNGDTPKSPVDWRNPTTQWKNFSWGFQACRYRSGRPTGIAVGPKGSLFVADDQTGDIYRIRPTP